MKNIFLLNFLAVVILISSSCDNCEDPTNPECDNYDPCIGMELQKADFAIGKRYSDGIELFFESDTVLYGFVYFKSNIEDAVSYKWTVGTDARTWDTKDIALNFKQDDSLTLRNSPVPVTLVVERMPNNYGCFPGDDGIDTVTKFVHFRSDWEAAFWGKWVGSRDTDTNNEYQLDIKRLPTTSIGISADYIYNMYGEGEDCFHKMGEDLYQSYREAYTDSQGRALNWETCGRSYYSWTRKLRIFVDTQTETIFMTWEEWTSDSNGVILLNRHTFKGRRPN
jgi:hypothetical protein